MKATNIIWDIDDPEDAKYLPTEIEIPNGMTDEDDISDYLSDTTGFCHEGFCLALSVHDLTRDQLILLKQHHLMESQVSVSYGELAEVDTLVSDEEIFAAYADTFFSEDDFPICDE